MLFYVKNIESVYEDQYIQESTLSYKSVVWSCMNKLDYSASLIKIIWEF